MKDIVDTLGYAVLASLLIFLLVTIWHVTIALIILAIKHRRRDYANHT